MKMFTFDHQTIHPTFRHMHKIFILVFLGATLYSSAQEFEINPKVKWGVLSKDPTYQILFYNTAGIVMSDGGFLKMYDYSLDLKLTEKLEFTEDYNGNKLYPLQCGLSDIGNKLVRFYYDPSLKEKSSDFYYRFYDKSSLKPTGDFTLFHPDATHLSIEFFRGEYAYFLNDVWRKTAAFFVAGTSPDGSKLCAIIKSKEETTKNEEYYAIVFDSSMKIIWEKLLNLKIPQKDVHADGFLVDDRGNVYMQAEMASPVKDQGSHHIFAFLDNGATMKNIEMPAQGKYSDAIISDPKDEKIYCGGTYSDNDPEESAGLYCMQIDLRLGKMLFVKKKPFTTEFIQSFPKEMKNKKQDALKNYSLEQIIFGSDQSIYLVADYWNSTGSVTIPGHTYFTSGGTLMSSPGYATEPTYTTGNFIVAKFSQDFSWMEVIPKYFSTHGEGESMYHSFFSMVRSGKLYLFFNDCPLNNGVNQGDELNKKSLSLSVTNESSATLVTIAPDGKWTKEILFQSWKEQARRLLPLSSAELSDGNLFFYTIDERKYRLGMFPLQ